MLCVSQNARKDLSFQIDHRKILSFFPHVYFFSKNFPSYNFKDVIVNLLSAHSHSCSTKNVLLFALSFSPTPTPPPFSTSKLSKAFVFLMKIRELKFTHMNGLQSHDTCSVRYT